MNQKGGKNSNHRVQVSASFLERSCFQCTKEGALCGRAGQTERRAQRVMQHCLLTVCAGGRIAAPAYAAFLILLSLSCFCKVLFLSHVKDSVYIRYNPPFD